MSRKKELKECGHLASVASRSTSHYGARPLVKLSAYLINNFSLFDLQKMIVLH